MVGIRRNGWKFILDIVMAVLLVLMYNKRVLGITFHEIGGLAVCGLFIIHKVLNRKWIKAVTLGLFSRHTPARQKCFWVLDILLFLSFGYVLVSGIMISKVVFPATGGGAAFKMGHYAAAALALALTGVHIGLHIGWMGQRMPLLKKMPLLLRRVLAITLSLAVLVFGGIQLTSTSFISWLGNIGAVFGTVQAMPDGEHSQPQTSDAASTTLTLSETSGTDTAATVAVSTDAGTGTVVLPTGNTAATDSAVTDATTTDTVATDSAVDAHGQGDGRGAGSSSHGEGGAGATGSVADVAGVVLSFMSLMLAFGVVTAWVDAGLSTLRRKRRLKKPAAATPGA